MPSATPSLAGPSFKWQHRPRSCCEGKLVSCLGPRRACFLWTAARAEKQQRDAFHRATREEAQLPLVEEKVSPHYAQHRTAHHKVRGWTLIMASKLFQCHWIKYKSPKFMQFLTYAMLCLGSKSSQMTLVLQAAVRYPSLIFQVQEDFWFSNQIFENIHVPTWDPNPTAWKNHLTCQSEENSHTATEHNQIPTLRLQQEAEWHVHS